MVILFGSYSRGDWVEDAYIENNVLYKYKSDYDILIVTATERDNQPGLAQRIKKRAHKYGPVNTSISFIFHSIDYLNEELSDGNYFFKDIVKEGTMLYDNQQFSLAEPRVLTEKEKLRKAKDHYEKWIVAANEFFIDYQNAF